MREKILRLLRENRGEYFSGEQISKILAVSRTAVWKHIQVLKKSGYDIESHPKRGYCLRQIPDLLRPDEIKARLITSDFGRTIYYYDDVDSTNKKAKQLAIEGCPHGTAVIAEAQNFGKGRLSRGWFSPKYKGIWLSVVLRPPFAPSEAAKCTLMAAVAINKAIRRVSNVDCGIKWPNDILCGRKKIVGILTEISAEMDGINYLVIGQGINVNATDAEFPDELRDVATSLAIECGHSVSRIDLTVAVLEELERVYNIAVNEGFASIFDEWRSMSITLGQMVDVIGVESRFAGIAKDINEFGELIVQTDEGEKTVLAGDVSIRPKQL